MRLNESIVNRLSLTEAKRRRLQKAELTKMIIITMSSLNVAKPKRSFTNKNTHASSVNILCAKQLFSTLLQNSFSGNEHLCYVAVVS